MNHSSAPSTTVPCCLQEPTLLLWFIILLHKLLWWHKEEGCEHASVVEEEAGPLPLEAAPVRISSLLLPPLNSLVIS